MCRAKVTNLRLVLYKIPQPWNPWTLEPLNPSGRPHARIYGHRHVLYAEDDGQIFSSIDRAYETPAQLWAALRGYNALTFADHSAGGPIATDWSIAPDPVFEPVTEIVSVHGTSEAADSPALIYSPVAGNFVRNALDRGYHLGFIGSGDSHDGHPGLVQLAGPPAAWPPS